MCVQIGKHNKGDDVSGVVKHDGGSQSSLVSRATIALGRGCRKMSSHGRRVVKTRVKHRAASSISFLCRTLPVASFEWNFDIQTCRAIFTCAAQMISFA